MKEERAYARVFLNNSFCAFISFSIDQGFSCCPTRERMSESESKKERKERKEERRPSCDMYWQYRYVADIAVLRPMRFHPLGISLWKTKMMKRDNDILCCVVVTWNKE